MRILKYFLIFLVIFIVFVVIYFSWSSISDFVLIEPREPIVGRLPTSNQTTEEPRNEKTKEQMVLRVLSQGEVFDYWVTRNPSASPSSSTKVTADKQNDIYYLSNKGKVMKIESTQEIALIYESILEPNKIISNPNIQKIVVSSGEGVDKEWAILDPLSNSWTYLPEDTESATWSPDGKRVAYARSSGDIYVRNIRDSSASPSSSAKATADRQNDKQTEIKLINLNQIDGDIFWNKPNSLDIISKPTNYAPSTWIRLDITNKNAEVMQSGPAGLILNWSPDKKMALELNVQNFSGILNIIDENGDLIQELSFLTMPQKCGWAPDVLFCAIPRDLKTRTRYPEDYLQNGFFSADDVFKFNLKTGEVVQIWSKEEEALDFWNMKVVENRLLFVNRFDGKLYSLSF